MNTPKYPLSAADQVTVRKQLLETLRWAMKRAGYQVTCAVEMTPVSARVTVKCPGFYQYSTVMVDGAKAEAKKVCEILREQGSIEFSSVTATVKTV